MGLPLGGASVEALEAEMGQVGLCFLTREIERGDGVEVVGIEIPPVGT